MSALKDRYPDGRRAYRCDACGLVSPWGESWQWYGSMQEVDDGVPVVTVCSDACRLSLPESTTGASTSVQREGR